MAYAWYPIVMQSKWYENIHSSRSHRTISLKTHSICLRRCLSPWRWMMMNQWTPTALISLCTLNSIKTVRAKHTHTTGSELTFAWPLWHIVRCCRACECFATAIHCQLSIVHWSLRDKKQQICLRICIWFVVVARNKQTAKNDGMKKQKRLIEFNCSSHTATKPQGRKLIFYAMATMTS